MFPSLWPATQLLITADTRDADPETLSPKCQLSFLDKITSFAGPNVFADSLVYSTSRNNTGWTALRMGDLGHVTYHHWDAASPNLLQVDVLGIRSIEDDRALLSVGEFWSLLGMRAVIVHRREPAQKIEYTTVRDDLSARRSACAGLGPGDHVQLMIDQTGHVRHKVPDSSRLDAALADLVSILKMRALTAVMSQVRYRNHCFSYSAIVGITTSHISVRVTQIKNQLSVALDVFSCRSFDPADVVEWIGQTFGKSDAHRIVLCNRHPKGKIVEL